ncbi:MAG: S8 family serine peptidase [Pseudomonadota bacterium]|nr:S8 family serine peptidase [Pseudomonadota bacterium]
MPLFDDRFSLRVRRQPALWLLALLLLTSGLPAAWADDGDGDGGGGDGDGSSSWPASVFQRQAPRSQPARSPARQAKAKPKATPQPASHVADELLALAPTPAALQAAQALGAAVIETVHTGALQLRVVRLRLPPGLTAEAALRRLAPAHPGVFELQHLYHPAQDPGAASAAAAPIDRQAHARALGWPANARACGRGQSIGIVDTPVATGVAALAGASVQTRAFLDAGQQPALPDHGTAIAALLLGRPGSGFDGLVPRARLFAAAPFYSTGPDTHQASASGLVRSLDWLASQRVQVIGMSLAGPRNLVLNAAVQRLADQGMLLVAAAGNHGPQGAPAYPAAFERVLAITAIDARERVWRRANQGSHIDYALPGVDVWTAAPDGQGRARSGTSYANALMVAWASQALAQRVVPRDALLQGRAGRVKDLGAFGHDPVFGWGLPQWDGACS